MRCDYHLHSSISADSQTRPDIQIRQAEALGLDEICFTEHLELHFYRGEDWHVNLEDYQEQFQKFRSRSVKLKFGLEAGIALAPEYVPELEAELRSVECDFVLASAHSINDIDPFNPKFFEGKTIGQAFKDYIISILTGIKKLNPELYSSVGHIDFPAKGAHSENDSRLYYKYAPDEIDELFNYIIPLGKCIEINTSSYRNLGNLDVPGEDWLHRYAELGGEYITLGSDAHIPEHVAFRMNDAVEAARRAGIKYYATYDQMVPIFHKI
jgi:histidinol phosphate phosphatase HisJ family